MKKTVIAALASLMLAGALCAVDGITTPNADRTSVIFGDGGYQITASSQIEAANSGALVNPNHF